MSTALTKPEQNRLSAAEADIERGGKLVALGMATIRDEKLYRGEYETFEEYCRDRWGIGRNYVNKIIRHEQVVANLTESGMGTNGTQMTERATREVSDLPPEKQVEVVKKAAETGKKPTAKAVKAAREEVVPKPEPKQAIVLDAIKRAVPKHLSEHHGLAATLGSLGSRLDAIKREAVKLADEPGGEFIDDQEVTAAFKAAKNVLTQARYWSECPRCKGKPKLECDRCDGHGYLPFSRKGHLSDADKEWLGVD